MSVDGSCKIRNWNPGSIQSAESANSRMNWSNAFAMFSASSTEKDDGTASDLDYCKYIESEEIKRILLTVKEKLNRMLGLESAPQFGLSEHSASLRKRLCSHFQ